MITAQTVVSVEGISGQDVIDFMLNCTDTDYQNWWPGTHLAFHTLKHYPHNLGNLVYFDEYVGQARLKFKGVVTEIIPGRKIVWQMKKGIKLPAWLMLEFEHQTECVKIIHTLMVGFEGIGKILDPVLRLYLSEAFIAELDRHSRFEFQALGEILLL
jgi:hypothetical protein